MFIMLLNIIIFLIARTTYSVHPSIIDYEVILKDNTHPAVDVTSQGDYTFIVGSDKKLYKWNTVTNAFDFFQGPSVSGVDVDIRFVTCNESGVIWICGGNYDNLWKFTTVWTQITITFECRAVKTNYGSTQLVVGSQGYNVRYYYYWISAPNNFGEEDISNTSTAFSFSVDDSSKFFH